MFIFAWRISCMHCFYCILSLSVQWSQVFSSSFCGLHSSASQRLLCEMLSFQYDMTQTGVTSWRGSQPWLPTRQLKDITWCDAQISLFVLLYKAYRCMPFFWLIVFTFTLLKEHLPYLPSPTNSVGFRNPFKEPPFGEVFDSSPFVVRWPMQRVGLGANGGIIPTLGVVASWKFRKLAEAIRKRRKWRCWKSEILWFSSWVYQYCILYMFLFGIWDSVYFIEWKILTLDILGQLHQPAKAPSC